MGIRFEAAARSFARWTVYPLLLAGTLALAVAAIELDWPLGTTFGAYVAGLVTLLVALEALLPYPVAVRITGNRIVVPGNNRIIGSTVIDSHTAIAVG